MCTMYVLKFNINFYQNKLLKKERKKNQKGGGNNETRGNHMTMI